MRNPPKTLTYSVLASLWMLGCAPPCSEVCEKLSDCSLESYYGSKAECKTVCEQQADQIKNWHDKDLRTSFRHELACIGASTCEEIEGGECFDGDLFPFDDPSLSAESP